MASILIIPLDSHHFLVVFPIKNHLDSREQRGTSFYFGVFNHCAVVAPIHIRKALLDHYCDNLQNTFLTEQFEEYFSRP